MNDGSEGQAIVAKPRIYINEKGEIKEYPRRTPYTDENGVDKPEIIRMIENAAPLTYDKAGELAKEIGVSRPSLISKAMSLGLEYISKKEENARPASYAGSLDAFEGLLDRLKERGE